MNILQDAGKYFFFNNLTIANKLEPKNYLFNYDDKGNCFLEDTNSFKFPDKIYDIDKDLREIIKKSFDYNQTNLGVLLTGNKGQGKSVTAKLICQDMNLPVIIINKHVHEAINLINFLKQIQQDYILFIDEFEKLFKPKSLSDSDKSKFHNQETFLPFMDGVLTSKNKVLFLLTTNDDVNEFLINRPSRIKFLREYNELSEELFNMIVNDKLVNKGYKEDLEKHVSFLNLNVDLLINIINDINMLDKPFSSFSNLYNYKFEQYKYDVFKTRIGEEEKFSHTSTLSLKPKATTTYFNNYEVINMIKFTRDEIVFESDEWDEIKKTEVEVKVRMVPIDNFKILRSKFIV